MDMNRLEKQIHFIIEADKLKTIHRRTTTIFGDKKYENDAEHSWHLTLCAVVLLEHIKDKESVDLLKVLKMLIIHDMVEIEAGDTYCYDETGYRDKEQREKEAANNLFSSLPDDQRNEFLMLWVEFEKMDSVESKYAAAIDRLQPLLQIYSCDGNTWIDNNIDVGREIQRNEMLAEIVPDIWCHAEKLIEFASEKGWLKKAGEPPSASSSQAIMPDALPNTLGCK